MKVLMYETKSTGCGKITGMFQLGNIWGIESEKFNDNEHIAFPMVGVVIQSCLTLEEIRAYSKGKSICLWEVENPERFDKPVELSECYKNGTMTKEEFDKLHPIWKEVMGEVMQLDAYRKYLWRQKVTRAPQSWCYAIYNGELVVLLSIHHKYAELIYSGEKTAEIRKSYPRKGE